MTINLEEFHTWTLVELNVLRARVAVLESDLGLPAPIRDELRAARAAHAKEESKPSSQLDLVEAIKKAWREEVNQVRAENEALCTKNKALRAENEALCADNKALRAWRPAEAEVVEAIKKAWQKVGGSPGVGLAEVPGHLAQSMTYLKVEKELLHNRVKELEKELADINLARAADAERHRAELRDMADACARKIVEPRFPILTDDVERALKARDQARAENESLRARMTSHAGAEVVEAVKKAWQEVAGASEVKLAEVPGRLVRELKSTSGLWRTSEKILEEVRAAVADVPTKAETLAGAVREISQALRERLQQESDARGLLVALKDLPHPPHPFPNMALVVSRALVLDRDLGLALQEAMGAEGRAWRAVLAAREAEIRELKETLARAAHGPVPGAVPTS